MRRSLICVVLIGLAFASRALAVDTIPDVETLADLRRLPVIHTDLGCDVRVGLAEPAPDAGPYRMIYCLATRRSAATQPTRFQGGVRLGPLSVELVGRDRSKFAAAEGISVSQGTGAEWLACQSLPVDWADDWTVRVSARRTTLLERPLGKSDHRKLYWSTFAVEAHERPADVGVEPSPEPACPGFDGASSLLVNRSTDAPEGAPLPGLGELAPEWCRYYWPLAEDRPLTLALEADRFVITPDGPTTSEPPLSLHLLARWWVNGRPIEIAKPTDRRREGVAINFSGHVRSVPRTVRFGLPVMLGTLKAGDTIGLQLLWVDQPRRVSDSAVLAVPRPQMAMMTLSRPPAPIPTNRIDFTLDAHLLLIAGR